MTDRFQLHRQKRGRFSVQGGGEACLQEQLHEGHQQGHQQHQHQQGHQQHQASTTDNHNPIPNLKIFENSQLVLSLQTFKILDADHNDKLDFNEFKKLSK